MRPPRAVWPATTTANSRRPALDRRTCPEHDLHPHQLASTPCTDRPRRSAPTDPPFCTYRPIAPHRLASTPCTDRPRRSAPTKPLSRTTGLDTLHRPAPPPYTDLLRLVSSCRPQVRALDPHQPPPNEAAFFGLPPSGIRFRGGYRIRSRSPFDPVSRRGHSPLRQKRPCGNRFYPTDLQLCRRIVPQHQQPATVFRHAASSCGSKINVSPGRPHLHPTRTSVLRVLRSTPFLAPTLPHPHSTHHTKKPPPDIGKRLFSRFVRTELSKRQVLFLFFFPPPRPRDPGPEPVCY